MKHPDATESDINEVMNAAARAFQTYRRISGKEKARFLRAIADHIDKLGDTLVHTAMEETHLPEPRIAGERNRTTGHLRMFADYVEEGSWVDARIDRPAPDRAPMPKPDLRKMLVPIGPIVVFGASNFPLAYSTAGGDTVSALAAGCPVVVKAHPAHPQTSLHVAECIWKAAKSTGMPDGVFGHVFGASFEVGKALVQHSHTRAVGFTGSFGGGKALYDMANERPDPIPVFSEMGSTNPVFILPGALAKRKDKIAEMYAVSITQSVGQFCTNPGILLGAKSSALDSFLETLGAKLRDIAPATMLHPGIASAYHKKRSEALSQPGVELIAESKVKAKDDEGQPSLATVDLEHFLKNEKLAEEVFGPYSILVQGNSVDELDKALEKIPGQLTATIIGEDDEITQYADFIDRVREKAGRLIFNGVPTGVEVCPAMQHGGPFPATTDSRFTSVGTDAIKRFVRPVAYQNAPASLLPGELKDENPLGIWRLLDYQWTKEKV